MQISGQIIDILCQRIFKGILTIENGRIIGIQETSEEIENQYILPGFVDAHVHIESSMLPPSEFARMAVVHGTVATVSDPHEIGNVLGVKGVEYMIEDGSYSPFKFYFGAPSCVPATAFETAGAIIDVDDIDYLMQKPEILYLAEMMNWPGVLHRDQEVMKKITIAQKYGKPIDGHAPGLMGDQAKQYCSAGISTDHECFTYEEALGKLKQGMKIIIREGSAAKNFEALIDLIDDHSHSMMFCSDDKHPDSLEEGHINQLVKRALDKDKSLFNVLRVACANPVNHYNLDVGLLRAGDPADFVLIDNLKSLRIKETYIHGTCVSKNGHSLIPRTNSLILNNFNTKPITLEQLEVEHSSGNIPVIQVIDGELITKRKDLKPKVINDKVVSDSSRDILKMVVVNRYYMAKPAIGFVQNFGFKTGAIASSVAHDSHNVIAIGVDDDSIIRAINLVIDSSGGLSAVSENEEQLIPLPIAGLMTDRDGYEVARNYKAIDKMSRKMGSSLTSPFMSLSFMALLVIPEIKLSDKGMFDGNKFAFI